MYDLRIDTDFEANIIKIYGINLSELIRNHRTGIIREYKRFGFEDKKIIICVSRDKIRSSIYCFKQLNSDGSWYYKVDGIRRP